MSKIQILPDVIINQIAAGEVVERPAAVVKELVENSIDAGAKNIVVRFSHGGKYSIIVEDDGCGLSTQDALLAFERHATSKITTLEDIKDINTFGFRGEALPSIASVSKFTMRTRTTNDSVGREIVFNGGKLIHSKECGTPKGTIVQVEQLFHNTPARRLFLKTEQTESNIIINLIKNLSYAEREIKFSLYSEDKNIFTSPISYNWVERTNEIFFRNEHLFPIDFEENECKIEGVICNPYVGNPCKKFFSFFVNKRLIENRLLKFATNEALSHILPNHREVIACLLITLNPKFVDVNVHPTKREVRFRNEQFIKTCVIEAINSALKKGNNIYFSAKQNDRLILKNLNHTTHTSIAKVNAVKISHPIFSKKSSNTPIVGNKQIFSETQNFLSKDNATKNNNDLFSWKFVGKIFDNCAIFESQSGAIVVNLKLATMKIAYEKLKTNTQSNNIQNLLFPIDINVNTEEKQTLVKFSQFFISKGIEIYQFGESQYRISGIPEWLSFLEAENMIRDILSSNIQQEFKTIELNDQKFAKIASKYIKYEPIENKDEIIRLVQELLKCENCSTSPNGRSTFFEFPKHDFTKRFGTV